VTGDLRSTLRSLRRTPGFAAVAVFVLAVGMGANTAVFSIVNALVLRPRSGRIDQVVGVFSQDRTHPDRYRDFSYPAFLDLRSQSGIFESLMAHTFSVVGITEGDATTQTFATLVSSNYFETLGVHVAAGRVFTADEERPGANQRVAIASYGAWRRAHLDPAFIGSTVRVNGADYTVVGVAPRGFSGTMTLLSPEWWFPLGSFDAVVTEMFKARPTGLTDRGHYAVHIAGILRPGLTREAAARALDGVERRIEAEYPATDRDQTLVLAAMPRMSVGSRPAAREGPFELLALLLALMAALVLVVACLNLANLLLARGAARRKEIAIRQALGASRARIVRQLVVEGLTLAIAGGAASIAIGWWTTSALGAWFASVLPLGIDLVLEPTARLAGAAAAFALLATIVFALGPAWTLSRPALVGDLKGDRGPAGRAARRLGAGSLLVIGQLAVSLALVAAGGLFVRAAVNAGRVDAGFSIDRHLLVSLDPSLAGYDAVRSRGLFRSVLQRVRSLPGVERASVASIVPFGEFQEGRSVRLRPADRPVAADFIIVGSDYFETLGMHLLRGRGFTRAEEDGGMNAPKTVVIDRPLARRLFADADPIGRPVQVERRDGAAFDPYTVVGVTTEMKHDLFDLEPRPHVFAPTGSVFRANLTLHIRTATDVPDADMLATIRREVQSVDPRLPILFARTMAIQRDRSVTEWSVRAAAAVFGAFGALALLLATIGVYGLKAYDVAQRTREIGIRMALGATASAVTGLVLREGARSAIVGLGIGLLLAAGVGKLVSGLLYRVSPFDPIVLAVAAAALALAVVGACYVPARRATRVTPLEALRTE
jgi:putative ABC transport system permease protein